MIDLKDFIIKETPRKTSRYKGETNRCKYFRCSCPNCNHNLGYISRSAYNKKKKCNKCSTTKRELFAKNHWSKLGFVPHNKGITTTEQRLKNKLKGNLRSRLNKALKGNYKTGSAVSDLGCSMEDFKKHIETQFNPNFETKGLPTVMTWDNYGRKGWHFDHVRPLASFDLTDPEQLKRAVHYTNLQPMWADANLRKGNKLLDGII